MVTVLFSRNRCMIWGHILGTVLDVVRALFRETKQLLLKDKSVWFIYIECQGKDMKDSSKMIFSFYVCVDWNDTG